MQFQGEFGKIDSLCSNMVMDSHGGRIVTTILVEDMEDPSVKCEGEQSEREKRQKDIPWCVCVLARVHAHTLDMVCGLTT